MSQQEAVDAFHDALLEDDPVLLYERAPCGYLSTTPDGRIVKANQTFLSWTGYTADELYGRPFVDLLSVGGRIFHETHYAPMLRLQGQAREIAVDIVRKRGDRLPVLLNARLDRDAEGEPLVVRVALFDATERRHYEQELLRAKELAEASEQRARTLARTLQQTLIPPALPEIPGLSLAGAYRPAGDGAEVGGDFYDVFPLDRGRWAALLGDVCGKGASAAVITAITRYTTRALAFDAERPADVLTSLNEVLCRHETDRFVTVALAVLEPRDAGWQVTLAVGGHPAPLRVAPGSAVSLEVSGPLVGVFADAAFEQASVDLAAGETLLIYSDGITEARGPEGFFGEERLLSAARRLGPEPGALVDGLAEAATAFQPALLSDDIALLALRMG